MECRRAQSKPRSLMACAHAIYLGTLGGPGQSSFSLICDSGEGSLIARSA